MHSDRHDHTWSGSRSSVRSVFCTKKLHQPTDTWKQDRDCDYYTEPWQHSGSTHTTTPRKVVRKDEKHRSNDFKCRRTNHNPTRDISTRNTQISTNKSSPTPRWCDKCGSQKKDTFVDYREDLLSWVDSQWRPKSLAAWHVFRALYHHETVTFIKPCQCDK